MKARELVTDVIEGFREITLEGTTVVYEGGLVPGLANITTLVRDRAASFLLRCAYHVADGAILVQRVRSDGMVPRNVAVALQADALTYAAVDEVGSSHPDLYGPEDAGYWPGWRDAEPSAQRDAEPSG